MDKKNIKRIIAREGLVIIICLFCAFISYWFGNNLTNTGSYGYRYLVNTGGHKYEIEYSEFYSIVDYNQKDKDKIFGAIAKLYPKDFKPDDKGILWTPDDLQIEFLGVNYSLKYHIIGFLQSLWFIFLFIAYPLYLLIRFIVWAVRTLKEK